MSEFYDNEISENQDIEADLEDIEIEVEDDFSEEEAISSPSSMTANYRPRTYTENISG